MSSTSPWMCNIESDNTNDYSNTSEHLFFGIFNDLPENIAQKIPRPITPFQANSEHLKNNNKNVSFDKKLSYDIEIDLASCGKSKMIQRNIQPSCFSPAPSFLDDSGLISSSPYLSVF
ncbi:hypothetical protein M9Y10_037976 [Tritrichomonas musculus]|uniref:Uncharacterized protein n=1 Tax=Tritrichomonas musculus TaxID=1915356 RepID=A0ABR2K738_9EUKA